MKTSAPYHSGTPLLVEACQKISISSYIREANRKLKEALLTAELQVASKSIELTLSKTALGGIRYWFKCPLCSARAGILFAHPLTGEIGCRKCLGLEYKSRRYKGMVESK